MGARTCCEPVSQCSRPPITHGQETSPACHLRASPVQRHCSRSLTATASELTCDPSLEGPTQALRLVGHRPLVSGAALRHLSSWRCCPLRRWRGSRFGGTQGAYWVSAAGPRMLGPQAHMANSVGVFCWTEFAPLCAVPPGRKGEGQGWGTSGDIRSGCPREGGCPWEGSNPASRAH